MPPKRRATLPGWLGLITLPMKTPKSSISGLRKQRATHSFVTLTSTRAPGLYSAVQSMPLKIYL